MDVHSIGTVSSTDKLGKGGAKGAKEAEATAPAVRPRVEYHAGLIPPNVADMRKTRKLQQQDGGRRSNSNNNGSNRNTIASSSVTSRGLSSQSQKELQEKQRSFGHGGHHSSSSSRCRIRGGSPTLSNSRRGLRRPPPKSLQAASEEEKQEEEVDLEMNTTSTIIEQGIENDARAKFTMSSSGTGMQRQSSVIDEILTAENDTSIGEESTRGGDLPAEVGQSGAQIVEDRLDARLSLKLVEARAIDESDIHLSLPQAQEVHFEEENTTKEGKGGTKYLYFLGALLVIVAIVVTVVLVVTSNRGNNSTTANQGIESSTTTGTDWEGKANTTATQSAPSLTPSTAPSSFFLAIQDLPETTVDAIAISGSPQQKAYEWTFAHPEFETMENWRKKQLLGLSTLYYSLDGEAWEDQKNWLDPQTNECYWFTDRDSPAYCVGYMCGYPRKYYYSGSLCWTSSAASQPPPPDPFASNCDDQGRFQFLKWASQVGPLQGTLPPEMFLLTSLTTIDLSLDGSNITGTIPTRIGMLSSLEVLDLSGNFIRGSIPSEIGMTNLTNRGGNNNGALALHHNNLSGSLPSQLGLLTNIGQVNLQHNQLTGSIPSQVGSLSNLNWLEAQFNYLSSALPAEIGGISRLRFLDISNNLLTGLLPRDMGLDQYWFDPYPQWDEELAGMPLLDLSGNLLSGTVPAPLLLGDQIHLQNNQLSAVSTEIGLLPSPSRLLLDLGKNLISSVPTELFLLTTLQRLHLGGNQLTSLPGEVNQIGPGEDVDPWNYCWLDLDLSQNRLESLPTELGSMAALQHWKFGENRIAELPVLDWANLTGVESISLPQNLLSKIPTEFFMLLPNLWDLDLSSNLISDQIPSHEMVCGDETLSSCATSLQSLNLGNNSLAGPIPNDLGNFDSLEILNLSSNMLTGSIPPSIFGSMTHLKRLDVAHNQLSGSIPTDVGLNFNSSTNTTSLYSLILSNNSLAASIPSELGVLTNLEVIDFSYNNLQGGIPSELGQIYGVHSESKYVGSTYVEVTTDWTYLHTLNLSNNSLLGTIPTELGALTNLQILDLSFNNFTGVIPSQLGLINATRFDNDWNGRSGDLIPAITRIVLHGNNFNGSLPLELCPWYCNSHLLCPSVAAGSEAEECNVTVLYVDCYPTSSLDCSLCDC